MDIGMAWTHEALERHLGPGRGQVERYGGLGDQVAETHPVAPFLFACGCVANRMELGPGLTLTPCVRPDHRSLGSEGEF